MNIIGQVAATASASVSRAPQNLWLDEADEKAPAEEHAEVDS